MDMHEEVLNLETGCFTEINTFMSVTLGALTGLQCDHRTQLAMAFKLIYLAREDSEVKQSTYVVCLGKCSKTTARNKVKMKHHLCF